MAKDLFSKQSATYARYRPTYPPELFAYILGFVKNKHRVWDCATGNGQAAVELSRHFEFVDASDVSEQQIQHAEQRPNIHYHICSAEHTTYDDNSFDLITVAQAYHWLNWSSFYDEATRVGKPGCIVAVWGYNLVITEDDNLNTLIRHFYYDVVGKYWDKERKYVDQEYATVAFDFDPLPSGEFHIETKWTKEQLLGYFQSWSSVQNYIKTESISPLPQIEIEMKEIWKEENARSFRFPIFLRLGRIRKG